MLFSVIWVFFAKFFLYKLLKTLPIMCFFFLFSIFPKKMGGFLFVLGAVAGVRRKFVFKGPVAQDVTTPPLVNEGDTSTVPGQHLTQTIT